MPDIQENVGALVTYGAQSDINTVATAGGTSQRLRRVSSSLNGEKDTFASNEVRPDQQISDMGHGTRRVSGAIRGELSTVTYDELFAALFRQSDWTAGVALDQSDFTSLAVSSGVITLGSGNPSTLGLRIGNVVDFAGMSEAGNNIRTRIIGMTSTTITTYPALADQGADTSCSITVVGETLILGADKPAFTFEHSYPGIDVVEVFKHCRIAGASISMPPTGFCQVAFEVMGRDWEVLDSSSAPYFTNATAAPNTNILNGISGSVRLLGTEQAVVSQFDMQISHNMNSAPVIGAGGLVPDIFYGRCIVTGQVSFFLTDKALLNAFRNETELDLYAQGLGSDGSFIGVNAQRLKLSAASKELQTDGGVLVQSPFQALLKSAGTGYDATTVSLQRSNS